MGGSHSREGLDLSDYSDDEDSDHEDVHKSSVDDLDAKLKALKLKYSQNPNPNPNPNPNSPNSVKLYLHVNGNTPKAKWILSDKLTTYTFTKLKNDDDVTDDEGDVTRFWYLKVGNKIRVRVRVCTDMQLKMFAEQKRVDFVDSGVWAIRFFKDEDYRGFIDSFNNCLFENVYGMKPSDENKVKVYGKDFMGWAKPELADDTMWEDHDDVEWRNVENSSFRSDFRNKNDLLEEFEEEAVNGGIRSVALGALDNSFLVNDYGVQVVKNFSHGIHGKGVFVKYDNVGRNSNVGAQKALLMKGETNMLLMPHSSSSGVNQLDIETGKIVSEWKFEKDGTEISMRDIANDAKGSQLIPSESTFLGLDDNRLSQWDMRDKNGMVLEWTKGHQFSRGTNFQCFATTGDGSIVVGSLDGKIRLYSTTSMRQAKTAFPGLGSPITHVDVTYDGKWILGTTDTYLVLICSLFTDKDGKTKTGFSGRMGSKIPAPRLLKLTPVDSHTAGKENKFHGGRFSWVTESGKQERHLVATVGKFSVIWDFQQVKNSAHECYRNQQGLKSCYCYKLMTRDESIIESQFMHDKYAVSDSPEAPLVVATPQKVTSFSMSDGKGKGKRRV